MKRLFFVLTLLMVVSMVLGACATPTPETVIQTVEVPKEVVTTVEVEKEVVKTVEVEKEVITTVEVPAEVSGLVLPRNETLYSNGQQWGPVKC
jgi:hypothetical protein